MNQRLIQFLIWIALIAALIFIILMGISAINIFFFVMYKYLTFLGYGK